MDAVHSSIEQAKTSGAFDVLYMQTPWGKLDHAELAALPLNDLAKPDATLYMWTDSGRAAEAAKLIEEWGFAFKGIAAIVDLAEQAPKANLEAKKEEDAADASASASAEPSAMDVVKSEPSADASASASASASVEPSAADVPAASGPEVKQGRARSTRVKSVQPPMWWTKRDGFEVTRATTEQLWIAVKGSGAPSDPKAKTLSYQVFNMAELAKSKAKARQPAAWCPAEWAFRRPDRFVEIVTGAAPAEARILDLFGDRVHAAIHAAGPGVPTGFVPALDTDEGRVGEAKAAIGDAGKVALRSLAAKLRKDVSAAVRDGGAGGEDKVMEAPVAGLLEKVSTPEKDWSKSLELKRLMGAVVDHQLAVRSARTKRAKRAGRGSTNADGTPRQPTGIHAKGKIAPELLRFLGEPEDAELAWTSVVAKVSVYIKEHKLQSGKYVNLDGPLKQLLQPEEGQQYRFFSVCSALSKYNLTPAKLAKAEASASAEDADAPAAKKQRVAA